MTTKLFALTFSVFLLLSQPSFLLGQSVAGQQQDWKVVQALTSGDNLSIETKDGKRLKGKLRNTSETMLTLTRKSKTVEINKDEIKKIYQLSGGSRAKSALIGTTIGAGAGAGASLITLGSTGGSDDTTGIVGKGVLIGSGIGLLFGLLVGKGSKRVLIYESN